MTPDAGGGPGGLSTADGSGPGELLRYRSAQGRWVVAAMILGSSVAGLDSTVVAVALPAIGRNLHADSWRWIFLINVPGGRAGRSQTSGRSFAADAPSPSRPG